MDRPRKRFNGDILPAQFSCSTFSSIAPEQTAEWIAMLSAAIELCNDWNEILPNAEAVRSPKSIEHALKRYQDDWNDLPALQRRIKQLKETKQVTA